MRSIGSAASTVPVTPRVFQRTGAYRGVIPWPIHDDDDKEPTASEARAQARDDINETREAWMRADGQRQAHCARSAIDSAATILVDAGATRREVVAAQSFLREALALDGRPITCSAESIDTVGEASRLIPEDQKWLRDYLASSRPTTHQRMLRVHDRCSHLLKSVELLNYRLFRRSTFSTALSQGAQ